MKHHVFISFTLRDEEVATRICDWLERSGVKCWLPTRDIPAGGEWLEAIAGALRSCAALVLVYSEAAASSLPVYQEVQYAIKLNVPVVAVRLSNVWEGGRLESAISDAQWVDGEGEFHEWTTVLVEMVSRHLPAETRVPGVPIAPSAPRNKGYVFISYVRGDRDFVERFKEFLKVRGYYYWDYFENERNYQGALYRELEQRIEGAAAFMCIVSEAWRETEWTAAEYIYAKEAGIPIFVIQAKPLTRPFPIILNQQTRIDMSFDFARGARVLGEALDKKGL